MPYRTSSRVGKSGMIKLVRNGMGAKAAIKNLLSGSLICYYKLLLFVDCTEYHVFCHVLSKNEPFFILFFLALLLFLKK
jgi:hypothetical protein